MMSKENWLEREELIGKIKMLADDYDAHSISPDYSYGIRALESAILSLLNGADENVKVGFPHGWIQHKGTDLCMDVRCTCGELTHIDGDFVYFLRCGKCGAKYAVGQVVALIPLSDKQITEVENNRNGFKKSS